MSNIQLSNTEWLVRSLDRNHNRVMDELQASPEVKAKIDNDKNGEISAAELTRAIKADAVEVRQGVISESRGFNLYVEGLETLKNVRATAKSGLNAQPVTPTFYQDDNSRDRYQKLVASNRSYDRAVDQLENSLGAIRTMTAGGRDATTRAIHIQATTTLNSTSWRTWTARFQQNVAQTRDLFNDYSPRSSAPRSQTTGTGSADPFKPGNGASNGSPNGVDPFKPGNGASNGSPNGVDPFKPGNGASNGSPNGVDPFKPGNGTSNGSPNGVDPFKPGDNSQPIIPADPWLDQLQPHLREQEQINTHLQIAYETMNNSLQAIEQQTRNLPDLQAGIRGADASISQAFSNITTIENSPESAAIIGSRLRTQAQATEAKATGHAKPYAGVGAGVGLVAGGAIGFFAGGNSLKNAAIGAGIGSAAAAGIGALIGHGKDEGYKQEAVALRALATRVESYNPQADKAAAMNANEQLYNALFEAREARDIDRAQVAVKNVNAIQQQAAGVAARTQEIADVYRRQ
jgi:hypothetical protein